LVLEVSELGVGEHKTAGDLTLPEGVELITDGDVVIAHIEARRDEEIAEAGDSLAEPEVISKGSGEAEE
jgi:large subunit ribosomal protein L25